MRGVHLITCKLLAIIPKNLLTTWRLCVTSMRYYATCENFIIIRIFLSRDCAESWEETALGLSRHQGQRKNKSTARQRRIQYDVASRRIAFPASTCNDGQDDSNLHEFWIRVHKFWIQILTLK